MAISQTQTHCESCGKNTLHAKDKFDVGMGCLLSLLTCGLFAIVWLFIDFANYRKPWICQTCGEEKPHHLVKART